MKFSSTWRLSQPLDCVVLDCDGTLSSIEGIDELAKTESIALEVKQITQDAMNHSGVNPEIYAKRLNLIQPTEKDLLQLVQHYIAHTMPDTLDLVRILQSLHKRVCVISAGMNPAVTLFAKHLGIAAQDVFAVDLFFTKAGNYEGFDPSSSLIQPEGKRLVINQIKRSVQSLGYIGDGANDLVVYDLVERFIGFGGAFYRPQLEKKCEFYVTSPKMKTLLPLLLTESEVKTLKSADQDFFNQALEILQKA